MFMPRRPSDETIRRFLAEQAVQPFSYAEVGATRTGIPARYTVDRNRVALGRGAEVFTRAVAAVRSWQMFAIERVQLCWPTAPIEVGTTVAILAGAGAIWSLNACRIVYTVDESDRFGFAYGTLPDHAVRGEERFLVEWDRASGEVAYDLLAFSVPGSVLFTIARPLLRRAQRRFAAASKAAMRRAVTGFG
jgi:uncharacterized protein (UPF0548 family)